jgi:predicted RNase H-like HicB family nuclease
VKPYTVIIEKAPNNYSAYVPDLPGCITTGNTVDDVAANIQEAIGVHRETMEDLGIPVPASATPAEVLPSDGRS